MDIVKVKNISDKIAIFKHNATGYEIPVKGSMDLFREVAKHAITKCIIHEDMESGEFTSQLIIDDGKEHEEVAAERLSVDPRATEAVKIAGSGPAIARPTGSRGLGFSASRVVPGKGK